nr:PP2C family protein-serine/threonine phosphatase [Lachnoclostridium sp. MSJ-17]
MIDDDHLAIVIADVSGKGVPAALFMMSSKIYINDHAMIGGTPAEILGRVNKLVCANNKAHMFVTVWLGILEISTGKLTTASVGHTYHHSQPVWFGARNIQSRNRERHGAQQRNRSAESNRRT